MFFLYCPKCKFTSESPIKPSPAHSDSEIGVPIYYARCKSCGYENSGAMLELSKDPGERRLFQRYINKHKADLKKV